MVSAVEEIARIAEACVVRPGDVLVLSFDHQISRDQADEISAHIRGRVPESVKVLVLGGSIHLHVLRSGEADQ